MKIKAVDKGNNNTSSIFKLPSKKSTSNFKILKDKKPDNSPIAPKTRFANPGENFKPKLTSREKGYKINPKFYNNQDLGSFRSNGESIQFICRDHRDEDGDRVRILVNGKEVIPNLLLLNRAKNINIKLEKGFNKIDVIALNQGLGGPNTAEFKVYDDNGNIISENIWNLATGVKASMLIIKD
ncbi:hypothetical protein GTQ40_07490 [Flavobacteriaceae bacterium R38]|nr:hypothetical protein [Flavobacteriaceae bacterium R38]